MPGELRPLKTYDVILWGRVVGFGSVTAENSRSAREQARKLYGSNAGVVLSSKTAEPGAKPGGKR